MDATTKPWWASRTIWAAVTVLAVAVLRACGVDAASEAAGLEGVLTDGAIAVAALVAILGRVAASRRIGAKSVTSGDTQQEIIGSCTWLCAGIWIAIFATAMTGCTSSPFTGDDRSTATGDERGSAGFTQPTVMCHIDFSGVPKAYRVAFDAKTDPAVEPVKLEAVVATDEAGKPLLDEDGQPIMQLTPTSVENATSRPGLTFVWVGGIRVVTSGSASAASGDSGQTASGSQHRQQLADQVNVQSSGTNTKTEPATAALPASNAASGGD
jgi:hypothetical protein